MQQLRTASDDTLTPREQIIVKAARVIASRQWPVATPDMEAEWRRDGRLDSALFAAGLVTRHSLSSPWVTVDDGSAGVRIQFVRGGTYALTAKLIRCCTETGACADLIITDGNLPAAAIDAFEQRAGRPIAVYSQTTEH